jgi:hypothetical protein
MKVYSALFFSKIHPVTRKLREREKYAQKESENGKQFEKRWKFFSFDISTT